MDHITDAMDMVDHMIQPAFCVREGIIVKANPAAAARMIEAGSSISDLLHTGQEEYEAFQDGCLYLTLSLAGQELGAAVTRKKDFDLFLLESESDRGELKALALAARELRDPLSGIMITTDRLFSGTATEDPETLEQLARINRNLFQILRLVGNMADASRYAAGSSMNQEVRDVRAIISETVNKAAALAEHTGIRIQQNLHPEPVFSLVDTEKLERAVFNILSNALKFTPGGETLRVSLTRRGNKLYFTVSDSGCGIQENLRGSLFSRYTREPALEDSRHGIGLGLVLIRAAAAIHGGTVLVDQPEQQGTRVTMTMAIRPGNSQNLRSPIMKVDYAGEMDHGLIEFSDILPTKLYDIKK